jgi:hypothetical protein
LKCLLAAAALNKDHPKVHEQAVRFKLAIDKDLEGVPAKSLEVIKSEFTLLPASTPLTKINEEYLAKQKDSAPGTLSGLKVKKLLSPDSASSCEKDVAAVIKLPSTTLEEATEALALLSLWKSSEVEGAKSSASEKWPKATVFDLAS